MANFEFNKIAAAVLVTGIIAMVTCKITDFLYHPELNPKVRGFKIDVPEGEITTVSTEAAKPAALDFASVAAFMHSADVAKGEALSKKCLTCHTLAQGEPNRVGPNLYNIINNIHAHRDDYSYSQAMSAKKGEKWDYEQLAKFIHNPREYLPGTKMTFVGIKDPKDIANLLDYIRTLSANPAPLPEVPAAAPIIPAAEAPPKAEVVETKPVAEITPEIKK